MSDADSVILTGKDGTDAVVKEIAQLEFAIEHRFTLRHRHVIVPDLFAQLK
jgi:hypothetical protein